MAVLDTIISGYRYPTGWLQDSLRGGERSLVYEVHAINQPGLIPGTFFMYAACQPDKVSEVYTIITQQLERARAGEFSPEELERAKRIITTTELMEKQTNSDCGMQAALDELYGLGYDYRDGFADAVRQVTLEDVREVARQYLTHPVIAVVTPQPDEVRFGMEPTAVENDEAMEPGAGEDK
jgi:zinc protease